MAAPTWSLLTSGSTATNATSFPTASVTLTAGRLYTLCVTTDGVLSSDRQVPTGVAHAAGSFTLHASQNVDSFVTQSIWRLIPAATQTGAVTISHTLTQDIESWALLEWLDFDSGAPLGSAATSVGTAGTTSSVNTVAATSANPARLAVHSWVNDTVSVGATGIEAAGWTEVADLPQGDAGFAVSMEVQARSSDAATASVTWSSVSSAHGSLVVEVREFTPPDPPSLIPGAPIMGGLYGRGQGFFKPGALASRVPRNRAAQDVAYDAVFRPAAGGPAIVSGSQAGAWSVRSLISTTKAGAWSVRNLAATTASGAWSVRASVTAGAGGAWSVRNLAATTASGAWSVRNLASTTASGAWSVSSVLPIVSTTLDGAWSVRALAASSQAGAWSVRNLAGTTRAGAWSVRNLAAGSAASAWSVRNLASTSASGAWSVRAAVGSSVTGAWSVRNLAAGSVGATWSVRNRVAGSKAGAWSVLNAGGYPDPADVRYGVQYGPTGTEYTGTMRGAGVVLIRRR